MPHVYFLIDVVLLPLLLVVGKGRGKGKGKAQGRSQKGKSCLVSQSHTPWGN